MLFVFFFFKQKTAYEMRISDWSSDVCSSDLGSTNADLIALARDGAAEGLWLRAERQSAGRGRQGRAWASPAGNLYVSTIVRLRPTDPQAATLALVAEIGRASCRERVGQYVEISVGAVALQKQ